jgi:hypothetical protein
MSSLQDLRELFSNAGFMPHLHCYLAKPSLVWTMAATDVSIGAAYVAISTILYRTTRQIRLPFSTLFVAFGLFIAACGATHFKEVVTLWSPIYWHAAFIKAVTAVASVATAVGLLRIRPNILQFARAAVEAETSREQLVLQAVELRRVNA